MKIITVYFVANETSTNSSYKIFVNISRDLFLIGVCVSLSLLDLPFVFLGAVLYVFCLFCEIVQFIPLHDSSTLSALTDPVRCLEAQTFYIVYCCAVNTYDTKHHSQLFTVRAQHSSCKTLSYEKVQSMLAVG